MQELQAIYDTRQSFYKKAMIETQKTDFERTKDLYSYNTLVASIIWNFEKNIITYKHFGTFSQTTSRHQKEFFKQAGLTDEEIKKLIKESILIKEV